MELVFISVTLQKEPSLLQEQFVYKTENTIPEVKEWQYFISSYNHD